ncbi:hypothetical protein N7474_007609 [Penicillium riverlandense]|uniref:uncharacterized protein n=1 Tax=Penicillium riverlandense TaxID=1903569 RepID=UPI00254994A6|nr:uncharacterized protein N7474_007609 [Penicillium riverlandense]KAJ5811308.1 hypothetical protein N7474_007609 [Penicillium riverlandense]
MVYRGKPSAGCVSCRVRRLKCDRRQPSCSQCLRIKRECSGYRDLRALRIYDQSEEVVVKARPRHSVASRPSKLSSADQAIPTNGRRRISSHITLAPAEARVYFRFYPGVLRKDPSPALQASIKAVGLASMSRVRMSQDLICSARQEYSAALLATNSALQDPTQAKSDSTLAAVVLLSTYEVRDIPRPILFDCSASDFFQAISNIFYKSKSSPEIAKLSKAAMAYRDSKSRAIENFLDILVRVGDLSVEIDDTYTKRHSIGDPAVFIRKALHLDTDLISWALSTDPTWRYEIIEAPEHTYHSTYSDKYHVYPTVGVASMWNNYRQTRIILHEIIRSMCMRKLELGNSPESQQTMLQSIVINNLMAEDICASVPYHFTSGEVGFGGVFRLLWPLFIAADYAGSTPRMKHWVFQTLRTIGNTMGIQQALMMSLFVKEGHALDLIPGEPSRKTNQSEP